MKLDSRGWGLREMIIYTCILLLLLLFAAFNINSLYSSLQDSKNDIQEVVEPVDKGNKEENYVSEVVDKNKYYIYEDKMVEATKDYLKDYNYDLTENILTVDLETLVNFGYIERIYDQVDSSICTGYTNSFEENNEIKINAFVKCSNYRTSS